MGLFGGKAKNNENVKSDAIDFNQLQAKALEQTGAQGLKTRQKNETVSYGKLIDGRTMRHKGERTQWNIRVAPDIKNIAIIMAQEENMAVGDFISKVISEYQEQKK